jgi:hypothetical protein
MVGDHNERLFGYHDLMGKPFAMFEVYERRVFCGAHAVVCECHSVIAFYSIDAGPDLFAHVGPQSGAHESHAVNDDGPAALQEYHIGQSLTNRFNLTINGCDISGHNCAEVFVVSSDNQNRFPVPAAPAQKGLVLGIIDGTYIASEDKCRCRGFYKIGKGGCGWKIVQVQIAGVLN